MLLPLLQLQLLTRYPFGGQDDTAAADSAAAEVTCRCCCGCGYCDDGGGPVDEGCFLLSSHISLLLLSFSRLLELAGCGLLPCTAVAAEEFLSADVVVAPS